MTADTTESTRVPLGYLVEGEDPSLVSQALSGLLDELLTQTKEDSSAIEEYGAIGSDEELLVGPVLDACRTPPFLAQRRIVVLREANRLNSGQNDELVEYLKAPLETTTLVLAFVGKAAPAALRRGIRAIGTILETTPPSGAKARSTWFIEQLRRSPVRLDSEAATILQQHLGQDAARLEGLLGSLQAAFGSEMIRAVDLQPYLGALGGVAPWDLTDAIDQGNIPAALKALDRMINGGERHPLQVLATLHRHFGAMLALDGAEVTDANQAAALTHLSAYPAQKALAQAKRLGHDRIARAIVLLAKADLDLRGQIGWPSSLVLEVLVAPRPDAAPARTSGRTEEKSVRLR